MRIGLLEDEAALAEQVRDLLEQRDHLVHHYQTGKALIAALKRETFDLLILDWNLPDITGLDVLSWLSANMEDTPPVLFLTSRGEEADIVRALDMGADDYVVKPIQAEVLMARTNALLRRRHPVRREQIETYGAYRFDTQSLGIAIDGAPVVVTHKEFSLALVLFQNLDRALSRAYLLERVWGRNPDLLTRTLDSHISRIRLKLALRPERGYRLAPVYSYGYRLDDLTRGGA